MSNETSNELYEQVIRICDDLYANRQLITKKSVKKIALLHGNWSSEELDTQLPRYLNEWRLNTLEKTLSDDIADKISKLEAQLCKYKSDLMNAEQTILRLQAELLSDAYLAKNQHAKIKKELRGLLG